MLLWGLTNFIIIRVLNNTWHLWFSVILMTFWNLFCQSWLKYWAPLILLWVENSQDCSWQVSGQANTGIYGLLVIILHCLIYLCADHTVRTSQTFSFLVPFFYHVYCLVIDWLFFPCNHRGPVMYKEAPSRSNSEVYNFNNINLGEYTVI